MPANGTYNNSGSALLVGLAPRDNWDSRHRAKQAELQYANIRQQNARLDADELERNVQNQINTIQAIKALPAEEPDKPLIASFVDGEIKDALTRIRRDYNGDARKFIETEGRFFTEQIKSNYLSSPIAARVERNKMEMDMARKAMANGESLIGTVGPDGQYLSADQQIQMFRNGEIPGFTFRGSYDPRKINAYETFGKMYNPNGSKYERAYVPEEEKLAFATSQLGDLAGTDYYMQSLRGRRFAYKTDPIEDKTLFNLDVRGKKMDMAQQQSTINKNNAAAAKDLAEARGETAANAAKNKTYMESVFNNPLSNVNIPSYDPSNPNNNKVIPQLGARINDLVRTSGGKQELTLRKYGIQDATEFASESLGINESVQKGKKTYSGQLPGILDIGGVSGKMDYIDLNTIPHEIKNSDSFLYVDVPEEDKRLATGAVPERGFKYFEIQVKPAVGEALGWDKSKQVKTENDKGQTVMRYLIKGYTPVPDFIKDKNIDRLVSKKVQGQKQANETFNSPGAPPQVFRWTPIQQ